MNHHLDDEEIERYSLQTSPETELERVEEHLLVCPSCRERVKSSDQFVDAMQQASSRVRREARHSPRRFLMPAIAFAVAATALIIFLLPIPRRVPPAFAVALFANRGPVIQAKAPAETPLALQPDVEGLPPANAYRLEMVDQSGKQIWTGTFPGKNAGPAKPGAYFVRLYSPAGELLREYGLQIEAR